MADKAGVIGVLVETDIKKSLTDIAKYESAIRAMARSVTIESRRINKEFGAIKTPKFSGLSKDAAAASKSLEGVSKSSAATALSLGKLGVAYFAVSRAVRTTAEFAGKGANFNLRLAEIATLTEEASFSASQQEQIVRSLSKAYGEDLLKTAPALYDAISAGATDALKANELLEAGIKLSVGTVSTQKQAVSLLSGVLNAYGTEVGSAADLTDDFFAIVQQGKLILSDLDPALGRVTPLAKAAGLSFKEVGATIVALTRSGSSASEAITKLRSILNASIKKQEDFDKAFQNLGLRFDSNTIKNIGFIKTLQLLSKSVGGSEEQLGKIIGRVEGLTGLLSLVDDDARLFTEGMDGMADSAGRADQAFGELRNSVGRKFGELSNAASNFFTEVQEDLAKFIVDLSTAAGLVDRLSQYKPGGDTEFSLKDVQGAETLEAARRKAGVTSSEIGTKEELVKLEALTNAYKKVSAAVNLLGEGAEHYRTSIRLLNGEPEGALFFSKEAFAQLGSVTNLVDDIRDKSRFGDIAINIPVGLLNAETVPDLVRAVNDALLEEAKSGSANVERAFNNYEKAVRGGISAPVVERVDENTSRILEGFATRGEKNGIPVREPIFRLISNEDLQLLKDYPSIFGTRAFQGKKLFESDSSLVELIAIAKQKKSGSDFEQPIPTDLAGSDVLSGLVSSVSEAESLNSILRFDVEAIASSLGDITKQYKEINLVQEKSLTLQQFKNALTDDQRAAIAKERAENNAILAGAPDRLREEKLRLEIQLEGITGLDNESKKRAEITKSRITDLRKIIPLAEQLSRLESERAAPIETDPTLARLRQEEIKRKQDELALLARSSNSSEAAAVEAIDAKAAQDLLSAKLRIFQLNSEISGGIDAQTSLIQANRAAEIASIDAKIVGNVDLDAVYEEQKALLLELVKVETDKARYSEAKRLMDLQGENLKLLQESMDIRGQTSGAAAVSGALAIADAEAELRHLMATQPLRVEEIELLARKRDLIVDISEKRQREAQYAAGELGFFSSLRESIGRAGDDMNSFGDLGKEVGGSFASLTVQWAQSLDEGGNAWDRFEDVVLKGLADIAIQFGILGTLNTIFDTGPSAGLEGGADSLVTASLTLGGSAETLSSAATPLTFAGLTIGNAADAASRAATPLTLAGLTLGGAADAVSSASFPLVLAGQSIRVAADKLQTAALLLLVANASGGGGTRDDTSKLFANLGASFANGGIMPGSMGKPVNFYARGGIVRSPQVAVFGEGPTPAEAFVPLPDGRSIPVTMDLSAFTESMMRLQTAFVELSRSRQAHLGHGGGGGGVTIQVDARGSNDPAAVEAAVDRGIRKSMPMIERSIGTSMQTGRSKELVNGVRQASRR